MVSMSGRSHLDWQEDCIIEAPVGQRSGRQYETDGGVRIAGGPVRMGDMVVVADSNRFSTSEGSTLPPPYASQYT